MWDVFAAIKGGIMTGRLKEWEVEEEEPQEEQTSVNIGIQIYQHLFILRLEFGDKV